VIDWLRPTAFSHRGGRLLWPENTLYAFQQSYDLGFRFFETDLHLTKDGQIVLFHDDYLDRTTDGSGDVWDYTLDELKAFDAAFRFGADRGWPFRGQGITVPTLEEIVTALPDIFMTLELKQGGLEHALVDLVQRLDLWDRVIVGGFDDAWARAVRRTSNGRIPVSSGKQETRAFWLASRLGIGLRTPAAALQVPVAYGNLTIADQRFLAAARRAGKPVHIWTVNDADEMHRLLDMGVDGLMSDRPDVLKAVFQERNLPLA
jgi:glycerophosphoryl diester phosphodiesterase